MLLIIGQTTRFDTDWVPFEITQAIDSYHLPIIAAYPTYQRILDPMELSGLWPAALSARIHAGTARVIHIPFKQRPIADAIEGFDHNNLPIGPLTYYTQLQHQQWGL